MYEKTAQFVKSFPYIKQERHAICNTTKLYQYIKYYIVTVYSHYEIYREHINKCEKLLLGQW